MPLPPFRLTRPEPLAGPAPRHSGGSTPGTVLFVCTGNICRSAYAQFALQRRMDALAPGRVETASLGTAPNQALTVPVPLLALAARAGLQGMEAHRPAALIPQAVREADLVLAASQAHRRLVLREVPRAAQRVFTILELAAVIRGLEEQGVETVPAGVGVPGLAAVAARHRFLAGAAGPALDITDPFGMPDEAYAAMVARMDPALETIAGALARAVHPAA